MCDDATEADNEAYLAKRQLNRREIGMGAGAAVAALLTGCPSPPAPAQGSKDAEPSSAPTSAPTSASSTTEHPAASADGGRIVTIHTPDGAADAFFVAPQSGQHPAVILWPDVAGLRDAYKTMAKRLAGAGYAVLAVNPYYRSAKSPILASFDEWKTDEGKAKIGPMRAALTPDAIAKDAAAHVAWLDTQKEVDPNKKMASIGYCMGGPFTFRTAAAAAARVGAIGSFHGGGLVTEDPTSPHLLLPQMKAAALICVAQNDDERDPQAKTTLQQAATTAKITAEIEVYPAQHGWCAIDSPVYDKPQAERAWTRMLATFKTHL